MCPQELNVHASICLAFIILVPQMAYPKSHNPFADDEEEEEEDFQPRSRGFDEDPDTGLSDAEKRQRYFQREVMRTAQSAVDSSHRSLGLIYESEKMGMETAEVCCICSVLHQFMEVLCRMLIQFPCLCRSWCDRGRPWRGQTRCWTIWSRTCRPARGTSPVLKVSGVVL